MKAYDSLPNKLSDLFPGSYNYFLCKSRMRRLAHKFNIFLLNSREMTHDLTLSNLQPLSQKQRNKKESTLLKVQAKLSYHDSHHHLKLRSEAQGESVARPNTDIYCHYNTEITQKRNASVTNSGHSRAQLTCLFVWAEGKGTTKYRE